MFKIDIQINLNSYYDMSMNEWYNLPKIVARIHSPPIIWKEYDTLYIASHSCQSIKYLDLREKKK